VLLDAFQVAGRGGAVAGQAVGGQRRERRPAVVGVAFPVNEPRAL
jgi:hypothetical protein